MTDDLAARMYPSMAGPAEPAGNSTLITDAQATAQPAQTPPQERRQLLDDPDAVERMYANQPIYEVATRSVANRAMDQALMTREDAEAYARGWEQQFRALGLSALQAESMPVIGNPTQEMREMWREDSKKVLQQDFGREGAGRALQDAKTFLAKHPPLQAHLQKTGLVDNPVWVRVLAARAADARKRAKL
ncbi:MAG: hypothetical protein ROZ37_04210 [Aromatoleum sp.]|jgi:hypothetical protein|uniref:hypothetical protein n=1 Tax=Aromatoleum sp. TaxID=2307007 RepID=UPI00289389EE|nr:hypothetical protein [Aromatoleum sp.]MDT3669523.1 hypothetical protein [Aromatoleum sp.]